MDAAKLVDGVIARFIGTKHERDVKKLQPLVAAINALETEIKTLSDEDLKLRFLALKEQVQEPLKEADPSEPTFRDLMQKAFEPVLVSAFALAREAGRRFLNMRHFDVQLIGGMVLHDGKIAEMKTGEGKTLVATLPAALNALAGRGVHIITVNDYLARRDAEWMSALYRGLGLSVGVIVHDLDDEQRRAAYGADITYGTNNEFGFDYLRDNMKYDLANCVQRGHHFAIVDEVDSILIDEARTPLIISGPAEESTDKYYKIDKIIPKLIQDIDYTLDEKHRQATLTEDGVSKCERLLSLGNLYDPAHMEVIHHVYQALRAHALYKRDVDYVVKDGEVIIVDEFTGRQMPGRRWSDGLHQAVEAKENVKIERENQTLATITFQNYFRMYKKLSGMTGTAETEAAEFAKIYNLDVVVIPTNRELIRKEYPDVVYRTEKEKFHAVVNGIMQEDDSYANGIRHFHERGQPVLVGTISIEKSEAIADILKQSGIPHQVLNAKQHERESRVVAQAGRKGAVTVATNMAGRGTDILLGGNPEQMTRDHFLKNKIAMPYASAPAVIPAESASVNATGEVAQPIAAPMVLFQHEGKIFQVPANQWKPVYEDFAQQCKAEHDEVVALGGLHILGTERHEARRIDNQLRGRAGRQGDPGSSRFFLSLEDDLMRIFGGERVKALMFRLGMTEGVPIESGLISRRIENAQKSVEAQNFDARKHLLEYDDVMNKQRETIYAIRRSALEGKDQRDYVLGIAEDVARELVNTYCPREQHPDQWNTTQFLAEVNAQFGVDAKAADADPTALTHDQLADATAEAVVKRYEEKEKQFGADLMRWLERRIILDVVDSQWKDHLLSLDHLKEGIGLRGYAQKDPIVEFKKEAFVLFEDMMARIDNETIRYLYHIQIQQGEQPGQAVQPRPEPPLPPAPSTQALPQRTGGAQAAVASAAARASEPPPQRLPDVARQLERKQQRQQKDLQYQTGAAQAEPPKPVRAAAKVGRNDPCPCGSGKKYKKCHGINS
ncbi:MAG TPA: preprotein translocase subunit SecA [Bradyrhizobium sp.]|uniref:preprotein translocase subunit SecA n=1 Tax=Bradyrhizobium sp. TaxID=376 RepID=UPI002B9F8F81|nr:preprotein translocase subunit SecA [Bradyrhizobium sp.]HXB78139.1 preprotein translocase subunit SecA [Bradyrhizobium sp.]